MAADLIESFVKEVERAEKQLSTQREREVNAAIEALDAAARIASHMNPSEAVRAHRKLAQNRVTNRIEFYEQVLALLCNPPKRP
jgi:hypothetical protein